MIWVVLTGYSSSLFCQQRATFFSVSSMERERTTLPLSIKPLMPSQWASTFMQFSFDFNYLPSVPSNMVTLEVRFQYMNFVRRINSVHELLLHNMKWACICLSSENEEMGTTSFLAKSALQNVLVRIKSNQIKSIKLLTEAESLKMVWPYIIGCQAVSQVFLTLPRFFFKAI